MPKEQDPRNQSCKEHLLSVSSSSYTDVNVNHPQVEIEEGFELAGSCGRYQILLQLLFTYVILCIGWMPFLPYFILDDPAWVCSSRNTTTNTSNEFCRHHAGSRISPENDNYHARCSMNRSDWTYTTPKHYSIVTEFDLVCGRGSWAALSTAVFFAGAIVSASMSGKCADTYGRKAVLITLTSVTIIGSISCAFVSSLWQLLLARVIYGMGMPLYNVGIVYLMEFVPADYRAISGLLYAGPYCFSVFVLDGIGFLEREWRKVQLYSALPVLIAFIPIVLLPESPRWLLATGKSRKADRVMKKIAKCNNKPFWFNLRSSSTSGSSGIESQSYSYIDLFRNKKVAFVTSAQALLWLTASMLYFTLGLESSKLGGNMYQVFALSTMFEVPGCFTSLYLCNRFGRKNTILKSFILCAFFTGAIAAIPRSFSIHHNIINIVLALLAKFFVNIAYCSMFIWSFELNPTVIRSQGMLLFNVLEQGGGMVAPFLVGVLQNVYYILPFIVMSAVTLVTSLLGSTLPETNGKPTREVYDDFFEKDVGDEVVPGDVAAKKLCDGVDKVKHNTEGDLMFSYDFASCGSYRRASLVT